MKFVKIIIISSVFLLSVRAQAAAPVVTEVELEQNLANYKQQVSATEHAILEHHQSKVLFETLSAARQGELSATAALEAFKLNNRSYAKVVYDCAVKNKKLTAVIALSALAGALINKLFFAEDCYAECDDFDDEV